MDLKHGGYLINDDKEYNYDIPRMKDIQYYGEDLQKELDRKIKDKYVVINMKNKIAKVEKKDGHPFNKKEAQFIDSEVYNFVNVDDEKN